MNLFGAHRSGKSTTHYARCATALIAFIWAGHAPALSVPLPLQNNMSTSAAIRQQAVMTDCVPCAPCYMAPPFATYKASSGDPGLGAASAMMRFVSHTDIDVFILNAPMHRTPALRLLYCRWLN